MATKRPQLGDQLGAQRTGRVSAKKASVADTFRQDEVETKTRTSLYLTESLAKRLKFRAVDDGVSGNEIVVKALERYLGKTGK